jgi:hypothetical protein
LFTFHRWQANLRVLGVEEIKTVPYLPISHPFVERLIGTIRREYLDHVLFWNAADLERKLAEFLAYYNGYRVHHALDGRTPSHMTRDGPEGCLSSPTTAGSSIVGGVPDAGGGVSATRQPHRIFLTVFPRSTTG